MTNAGVVTVSDGVSKSISVVSATGLGNTRIDFSYSGVADSSIDADLTTTNQTWQLPDESGVIVTHLTKDDVTVGNTAGFNVVLSNTGKISVKNSLTETASIDGTTSTGILNLRDGTSSYGLRIYGSPFSGISSSITSIYAPAKSGTIGLKKQFSYQRQAINCLVSGAITIGTTDSGGGTFVVTNIYMITPAPTGVGVAPTVSIGDNSPSYSNLVAGTAPTPATPQSFLPLREVANSTDIKINISVAATGYTAFTTEVYVFGFYKDL